MLEAATAAFFTFFVIFDPLATGPLFLALTRGASDAERRVIALRGTAVAAGVLIVFALGGDILLSTLGITLAAFRIAGGALLFILAIEMLFAHQSGIRSTTSGEDEEASQKKDVSVFPLGIPLIAGPGAMASVILLTGRYHGHLIEQAIVVAVMLGVLLLSLAFLLLATRIVRYLGVTGINVITRVFGIILGALAVQYILDGLRATFPVLG